MHSGTAEQYDRAHENSSRHSTSSGGHFSEVLCRYTQKNSREESCGCGPTLLTACASLAMMAGYTPEGNWFTRDTTVLTLAESLRREAEDFDYHARFETWPRPPMPELAPAQLGSAPFQFKLSMDSGLDTRRMRVINRLMELTPHFGLAVLERLVSADVTDASYARELCDV